MTKENYMAVSHFVNERESHESCLQYWINSDEDALILDIDPSDDSNLMSIGLITDKITESKDSEGKTDCQVWGVPFDELAKFVDAVRAIKKAKG